MQRIMRWGFRVFTLVVLAVHSAGCRPVLSALLSPTETPTSIPMQVQPTPTANILFPYDASVLVFPQPEDRQAYQVVDLIQYNDFFQSLALSEIEKFEWVSDPLEIATRLESWPPDSPECQNKKIYFLPTNPGSVILVIIGEDCPDDSIAAEKTRIEMHDDDGRWVVDWVGRMWKCKRGEIESRLTDWHTYLCP